MTMRAEGFKKHLAGRGYSPDKVAETLIHVREAEDSFKARGKTLEDASVDDYMLYVEKLMEEGRNTEDRLDSLSRFVQFLNLKGPWIYFASILGGRTILPSIRGRLTMIAGEEASDAVFSKVQVPPLGSPPSAYLDATSSLMKRIMKLSPDKYRRALAGNHHKVPEASFEKHRGWLREEGSIDAWLKRMHKEAVADLERHLREGKVWFEQVITPEVVEYVKGNQEILSGVRRGKWIYTTKIPYSPKEYLAEADPLMKRYYMCHCPLAREAVLRGEPEIPMEWCYCSAGFVKLRYDVVFGTDTEAEVLESVFSGSDRCRFRIRIPDEYLDQLRR